MQEDDGWHQVPPRAKSAGKAARQRRRPTTLTSIYGTAALPRLHEHLCSYIMGAHSKDDMIAAMDGQQKLYGVCNSPRSKRPHLIHLILQNKNLIDDDATTVAVALIEMLRKGDEASRTEANSIAWARTTDRTSALELAINRGLVELVNEMQDPKKKSVAGDEHLLTNVITRGTKEMARAVLGGKFYSKDTLKSMEMMRNIVEAIKTRTRLGDKTALSIMGQALCYLGPNIAVALGESMKKLEKDTATAIIDEIKAILPIYGSDTFTIPPNLWWFIARLLESAIDTIQWDDVAVRKRLPNAFLDETEHGRTARILLQVARDKRGTPPPAEAECTRGLLDTVIRTYDKPLFDLFMEFYPDVNFGGLTNLGRIPFSIVMDSGHERYGTYRTILRPSEAAFPTVEQTGGGARQDQTSAIERARAAEAERMAAEEQRLERAAKLEALIAQQKELEQMAREIARKKAELESQLE